MMGEILHVSHREELEARPIRWSWPMELKLLYRRVSTSEVIKVKCSSLQKKHLASTTSQGHLLIQGTTDQKSCHRH